MSTVFDRLNAELEEMGERLRSVLEGSKLKAEKAGLVAKKGKAAYRLGLLAYAREKGSVTEPGEWEKVVARMDDLTARISELDRKIAEEEGEDVAVHEKPAPDAAEAEVNVEPEAEKA
jgi:hypothetical protein